MTVDADSSYDVAHKFCKRHNKVARSQDLDTTAAGMCCPDVSSLFRSRERPVKGVWIIALPVIVLSSTSYIVVIIIIIVIEKFVTMRVTSREFPLSASLETV